MSAGDSSDTHEVMARYSVSVSEHAGLSPGRFKAFPVGPNRFPYSNGGYSGSGMDRDSAELRDPSSPIG